MGIKRYVADADNTITNAYKANLSTRGVSGNMGQSDILEVFSIYGQASSSADGLSSELARILVQFPVSGAASGNPAYDRVQGTIPASGSVSFYLKMYNAAHSQTTPKDFKLVVSALSRSWREGLGLDMENYSDIDSSNWITASLGPVKWTAEGGDWYTDASSSFTASFDTGFENMDLDVTPLVEQWINSAGNTLGSKSNYGFMVKLSSSLEDAEESYYTKMFFARGSQFTLKRPVLEARWDNSKTDDRGQFYLSSSLVPASDNLMKLYLYNVVRGQLTNIPAIGTGSIIVSIYSGSSDNTSPSGDKLYLPVGGDVAATGDTNITGGYVETGIYSCSFPYASSSVTTIFDVWHSGSVEYHTGSGITVKTYDAAGYNFDQKYASKVTNMRSTYNTAETARFRLFVRQKNWSPTIYNVASQDIETSIIDNAYYKVIRVSDSFEVIPFGTGSDNYTKLSYDRSGSYFDLDMSLFSADDVYELSFTYKINGTFVDQPETFRFRVD